MKWQGVIPAITTPFKPDLSVDADLLVKQVDALVRAGCTGIVALGSLGEGGSLSFDEKKAVLRLCKEALAGRASLVAGVAALTTAEAERLAELGREQGADGLMVLPPYVYKGDWRETRAHFEAVIAETSLPCMLYNNPIAYGTDVLPEQLAELAQELPNLVAVKESSADVRRVTAVRSAVGDRLQVLVGVDDLIVEGIAAGAVGWIAGLADALPLESVRLFELAERASRPRRSRSTAGSCRCCGSTPSRSSFSSSSSSRPRPVSAPSRSARRGCRSRGRSARPRSGSSATPSRSARRSAEPARPGRLDPRPAPGLDSERELLPARAPAQPLAARAAAAHDARRCSRSRSEACSCCTW